MLVMRVNTYKIEWEGALGPDVRGYTLNTGEHAMMERLIIDDLLHWAKTYKVCPAGEQGRDTKQVYLYWYWYLNLHKCEQ